MDDGYSLTSMIVSLLTKIHSSRSSLRLALVSQRKKFRSTDNAFWGQVYSNIMEIEKNYITISFIERFFIQKNFRSIKSYLDLVTYWHFWKIKGSERISLESKKFFFTSNKQKRLFQSYIDSITKYSLSSLLEEIQEPHEKWSLKFSLPVLLYSLLSPYYSHKELFLLGKWFNTPSVKYFWINNQDLNYQQIVENIKKKISVIEVQSVPKSFIISDKQPIQQLSEFKTGNIIIQDLGATIVAQLIPKISGIIIDLCASPGNKTIQIFDKYVESDTCTIYAGDLPGTRFNSLSKRLPSLINADFKHIIENGIESLKLTKNSKNLIISPWDGTKLHFQKDFADLIFIDAPCTGTGTMGSKPDVRSQLTEEFLHKHTTIQQNLLEEAHRILKPGGYLFYSTCSLLNEENEQQISNFIDNHKNYSIIPLKHNLNYPKLPLEGSLKLFPPLSKTDGFFAILLQKQ